MYSQLLEELSKAIGARLLITFEYQGATYEVEPHLVGRDHNKLDCLLAWTLDGPVNTADPKGNWLTFRLSEISDFRTTEQRFCKQRPGYDPYESSMSRIYYRI